MKKQKKFVLKRRFRTRKDAPTEVVDITGYSKYLPLTPPRYFDSDVFARYESDFPQHAAQFYAASGADEYNHDALDLEIDKQCEDERAHYALQREHHLEVLEMIRAGIETETKRTTERLATVREYIRRLSDELAELEARYKAICAKGASKHA